MAGFQWLVELVLLGLLVLTMVHAIRLERALGGIRQDRAALADLAGSFDASAREAEAGIERLRALADGAGRAVSRQADAAVSVKDDLVFLVERGERLADRLDALVRAGRTSEAPRPVVPEPEPEPRVRSQAERDLLAALRVAR